MHAIQGRRPSNRRGRGLRLAVAVTALVLLAGSCSSDSKQSSSTTTTGGSATAKLLPIDNATLQATVETAVKELLVPGAVVVLRTPNGDFTTTYGTTTLDGPAAVALTDHLRIGSITKTWTATVILQEVQEGKLALEDPVSKYRPDVPNGDKITITQLLSMRSGLYNYSESLEFNQTLDDESQKVWTTQELLDIAYKNPPYFPPGTGFHYSNTNTILLGLIAEQLGGQSLARLFQDRLLTPLAMKDTVYPDSISNTIPDPYSHGYMYGSNVLTLNPLPPEMQAAARAGTLKPNDFTNDNPSWTGAAGQGISTANDLVKWAQALVGGTLLDPDLQAKRLASVQLPDPAKPGPIEYGLGIAKFGNLYGHTGELPGFSSFMGYDPDNRVTLVVWANLYPSVEGSPTGPTIAQRVLAQVYAPPGAESPTTTR